MRTQLWNQRQSCPSLLAHTVSQKNNNNEEENKYRKEEQMNKIYQLLDD